MRVGNQSLSKALLEKAGGIDTNFDASGWYMDLELGLRLFKNGARFQCDQEAVTVHVSHYHSESTTADEEKNYTYFLKKYPTAEVALLPLFFKSSLTIQVYSEICKRINKIGHFHAK